jgi:hypothetical protein
MITNHDSLYKIIEVHNPLKNENYYMNRYINPNIVFVRNGRISFGNYIKLQSAPLVSVQRKFCGSVEMLYSNLVGNLVEIEILVQNKIYSTIGLFKHIETYYNPTDVNSLFNIKEELIQLVFSTIGLPILRIDIDQIVSLRKIDSLKSIERNELTINKQYFIMDTRSYDHIGAFWLTDISDDGVCYFRDYHQMYYKNNKNSLSFQADLNDKRFTYWEIKQKQD